MSAIIQEIVLQIKNDMSTMKEAAQDQREAWKRTIENLDKLLMLPNKCESCGHTQTSISGMERAGEDWG